MANIWIQHQDGRGEYVYFNESQARRDLERLNPPVPTSQGSGSSLPTGCLTVLAIPFLIVYLFFSSLCSSKKPEAAAAPSPTPVVQAQAGYAPRAQLVRMPEFDWNNPGNISR